MHSLIDKKNAHLEIDNDDGRGRKSGGKSDEREKLIQRALDVVNKCVTLTRNNCGVCHATFSNTDACETVPLNSPQVLLKIKRIVRDAIQVRLPKAVLEELVDELREAAESPSIEVMEVNHRVARGIDGQVLIDLCNPAREVLEVDARGYRLHDFEREIPLFLRSQGMMPLPDPTGVRGNLALLRSFVNVASDDAWRLLIVFLLYSCRPGGPYVILVVYGTAGSSKSTFSRVIRRLIDPSSVSTQSVPKSSLDLMITASNSHLLVFDNARQLSLDMSDALCRLATGGGMRNRALYTNDEETLFHAIKPCVLNGIDDIASQADLLSRCIQFELPVIKFRRTEEEFNRSFEKAIGPIYAGLMDALSKTLAALPNVTEVPQARMADFEHFGMAVELALSWPEGSFTDAYARNQKEQMWNVLGGDPLALAIKALVRKLVKSGVAFTKTPTALLNELKQFATAAELVSKAWPQSPHSLSKKLKKMEPALRACGIGVEPNRSGIRTLTLTREKGFK